MKRWSILMGLFIATWLIVSGGSLTFGRPKLPIHVAESCLIREDSDCYSGLLRIATFNIRYGRGQDNRVDLARIADVITDHTLDVIILNEVDQNWPRSGYQDQASQIGQLTGMKNVFYAPALRILPWLGTMSLAYGNAMISHLPWASIESVDLPRFGTNEPRNLVLTHIPIDASGKTLHVVGTHLSTNREERHAQVEFIRDRFPLNGERILLLGDFNSQPHQADMQILFDAGWVDLWSEYGQGDGFTFPSDAPKHRIDYILTSPETARAVLAIEVGQTLVSDHLPIIVELDTSLL